LGALIVQALNPLSFSSLLKTILFQVGFIGSTVLWFSIWGVKGLAWIETIAEERTNRLKTVLLYLFSYTWKGVAFIVLTGVLGILLTDIGWPPVFHQYGMSVMAFLMARSGAAPNGAHLLSYIPLPLVGLYVAVKFRKDVMLDCYQGILLVGFGVAFHELPWLFFYLVRYYGQLGLYVGSNFTEDFFFGIMCVMLIFAFWLYPYRKVSMKAFLSPLGIYSGFLFVWFLFGLPVTTINNFQIGKGPFEITSYWADPLVNAVEIASWILVAVMLWVVIWRQDRK
jgi:hypothetical protein